jgi:two-component system sensor histidine kinase MprB
VRRLSFRRHLTLYSAVGIALVLLVGSAATYLVVRNQLRGQIDNVLREHAANVPGDGRVVQESTRGETPGSAAPRGAGIALTVTSDEFGAAPVYVQVVDEDATPTSAQAGGLSLPVSERAIEVARTGRGAYYTDVDVRGTHLRMYVTPAEDGRALLAARSLSEVESALSRLGWGLGITCLAGILLAGVVGAVVARGALRPVTRLTATAERVSQTHDLSERIEAQGDDELARLGRTFNAMLDSLETAIRSQRQLVADASHELRTPLTSLRTNIELLRQRVALSERDRERLLQDVANELEELTTLVANLVELARGSQRDLHLQHVRLDEVAERVVERARARYPQLDFTRAAEPTTVWGDPEALDRAIWNLVENAAKWSNGGRRVELTIAGGEIVVCDQGPGVPAADRPFVFDRFYRSETARAQPGSGLGLAIVRQIAESHGGRVEVDEAPGGGARFRFTLVEAVEEELADHTPDPEQHSPGRRARPG